MAEAGHQAVITETKSNDRRAALIAKVAEHILGHGLSASSLRPLAKAAQISDRMLLYYFKDKAAVITAALEVIASRLVALLEEKSGNEKLPLEPLRVKLVAILSEETLWPYMRLWLEIAALAARDDLFFLGVGERMARGFLAWGAAQLDSATPEDRERDAARLLVMIEGMIVLKAVGLHDII
jgi:AcrR family transcriptional regulator